MSLFLQTLQPITTAPPRFIFTLSQTVVDLSCTVVSISTQRGLVHDNIDTIYRSIVYLQSVLPNTAAHFLVQSMFFSVLYVTTHIARFGIQPVLGYSQFYDNPEKGSIGGFDCTKHTAVYMQGLETVKIYFVS